MKYADLHIHSEYTLGNGITTIPELVKRAKEFGMESIALTDSGSVNGFDEFRIECDKYGIKSIFGCGFYVAPLGLDDSLTHHLVLLAKGEAGYNNIIKLSTYKRVDFNMLEIYSDDIIALTGGLGGLIDKPYIQGNRTLAINNLKRLKDIYGCNLYLELQDNGMPENKTMISVLTDLSEKESIETVVTGGSFYLDPSDYNKCNSLRLKNSNRELKSNGYYFKSPNEIFSIFRNYEKAVENSFNISQSISIFNK